MDREELERLLRDLESDRVERTVSLTNTDKFAEAICAFANDLPNHRRPGYLFVGAHEDGTPSGAQMSDQLLLNLAAIRADGNVLPTPAMNVQKHELLGADVAVVEVLPSDLPPVRYKGRIYVRIGPRRGIASEAEERILTERRVARAHTWDARPCREASLEDLALDLFLVTYRAYAVSREVIEENNRSVVDQLAALRFFDPGQGCPTHAGVLLFAHDPLGFVPGAYVQYVRYDGTSPADDPIEERRVSGDLLTVMRDLDHLGKELAGARPVSVSDFEERTLYRYPPRALRELILNAVIHRSYERSTTPVRIDHFNDRLEIQNPGGLYGDLTPEVFPRMTSYRNPILAEAAKTLGFVNRFGRGVAVAQDELRRNTSPSAEFAFGPNHFLVVVRERP